MATAFLRPYRTGLVTDKQLRVGASPTVNWDHPMANGLIGAYLPGIAWHDLTGINGPLTNVNSVCIPAMTADGPSLSNSGATLDALDTAAGAMDSRISNWSVKLSYYVRWRQIASTGTSSGGTMFVQDASNSSVGFASSAGGTPSNLYCMFYTNFSRTAAGSGVSNAIHGVCCAMQPNGSASTAWVDGVQYLTTTTAGVSTCTQANTKLSICGFSDISVLAVYFWNRLLTITDAVWLENDPYGMFKTPAHDLKFIAQSSVIFAQNPDTLIPEWWY
jgi:hypothetical protein